MDFGDLKDDKVIQEKLNNFSKSVSNIEALLNVALSGAISEELSLPDKLNYDLFIAYCLNTLYFLYLRSKGIDPNENEVKKELGRVREYMIKAKTAIDRHKSRKTVDVAVAGRFIKHGIGHTNKEDNVEQPIAKKRKFNQ